MSIEISEAITLNWPETESKLLAETTVEFVTQKANAIARAKREVYGSESVPDDESDIPDKIAYWIADKATTFLIPLAKQYYAIHERQSDSKEGATLSYYDKVQLLDGLRVELEGRCSEAWEDVQDLVGSSDDEDEIPAISTDGMMIDPVNRAANRGPW